MRHIGEVVRRGAQDDVAGLREVLESNEKYEPVAAGSPKNTRRAIERGVSCPGGVEAELRQDEEEAVYGNEQPIH